MRRKARACAFDNTQYTFQRHAKAGLAVKASSKPCSEDRVRALESIFQLRAIHLQGHTTVSVRFCWHLNRATSDTITPRIALSDKSGVIENVASLSGLA